MSGLFDFQRTESLLPRDFHPECEQDPELFFPPPPLILTPETDPEREARRVRLVQENKETRKRMLEEAKAICRRCPQAHACLETALRNEGDVGVHYRWGIWGGTIGRERLKMSQGEKGIAS